MMWLAVTLTERGRRGQDRKEPPNRRLVRIRRGRGTHMAQHLCIVAHDSPLLLGYLNIVLQHLTADGNELQIIIDRRPDLPLREEPAPPRQAMVSDQRRVRGVDELLRTQGYAIVSRRDGMSWQLSEG